jgi:hypothetical protein
MDTQDPAWRRHRVEGVGLSFEVYEPWPLRTAGSAESGGVFQQVGNTDGVVFVRWGPEETIDAFVPRLSDYLTTAIVTGDDPVTFRGRSARHLLARTERRAVRVYRPGPAGPTHSESPARVSTVEAYGLVSRGKPFLIGHLLVEGTPEPSVAGAERIVESVEWLD